MERIVYRGRMGKRVIMILGSVIILSLAVYVAIGAARGDYAKAAQIGSTDIAASGKANRLAAAIKAMPGVSAAGVAFSPGLFGTRSSRFAVSMATAANATQTVAVAEAFRSEYRDLSNSSESASITVSVPQGSRLEFSVTRVTAAKLDAAIRAWESARTIAAGPVGLDITGTGGPSPDAALFILHSEDPLLLARLAAHPTELASYRALGFTWTAPGLCGGEALPDERVAAAIATIAAVVPVRPCTGSGSDSGLEVLAGSAGSTRPPAVMLGFSAKSKLEPLSDHISEFVRVARIAIASDVPMNVGFFGAHDGVLTSVRFTTGTCGGEVTQLEPSDPASIRLLASHGIDVAKLATLGECAGSASK